MISRAVWIIGSAMAAPLLLAGCSVHSDAIAPPQSSSAAPSAVPTLGSLGVGFYDPANPPGPEGTVTPTPGSWENAHPPKGYSVVLLNYGDRPETRTLEKAVKSWAADEDVKLQTVVPKSADSLLEAVQEAIDKKPDLVIGVGNEMSDPLAAITPGALSQQFLVVGSEIAEPTGNVTAADWTGAGFRGEGLGTPTEYDPKTFTDERAGRALRAGVAAVVNGLTGIVVWVK